MLKDRHDDGLGNRSVNVDVKFIGSLPGGARYDLTARVSIETEEIRDATSVTCPLKSNAGARVSVFRISEDGHEASRVVAVLGCFSSRNRKLLPAG